MTGYERERRRRAKHKAQQQRRRENVIKDAERRLLGPQDFSPGAPVEELHYDHKLTDGDRTEVYRYLASRYPSIPIVIP